MSKFLLGIARLGQDPHLACFMEHVKSVAAALRTLGHEVEYASEEAMKNRPGRLIIWGANKIAEQDPNDPLTPPDSIVFQTEQVSAIDTPTYFIQSWIMLRNFTIWDYAQSNVDTLKKLGMTNAIYAPLGYHPAMEVIKPVAHEDIDILFYGSAGGPRREILNALDETGLNVVRAFNVYGEERDAIIARAKVVINLHYYERGVFEIFRCSHLFANRKCVVNEAGGRDPQLEELASRCTAYTPRQWLVDECKRLVADAPARRAVAERGYEAFKKVDLVENIRVALEVCSRGQE